MTFFVNLLQTSSNNYMQRRNSQQAMNAPLQSGGGYEGFLKDLLDLLAKDLEFDYFLEEDLIHGYLTPDGNWTGLIGSLIQRVSIFFISGRISFLMCRRTVFIE